MPPCSRWCRCIRARGECPVLRLSHWEDSESHAVQIRPVLRPLGRIRSPSPDVYWPENHHRMSIMRLLIVMLVLMLGGGGSAAAQDSVHTGDQTATGGLVDSYTAEEAAPAQQSQSGWQCKGQWRCPGAGWIDGPYRSSRDWTQAEDLARFNLVQQQFPLTHRDTVSRCDFAAIPTARVSDRSDFADDFRLGGNCCLSNET